MAKVFDEQEQAIIWLHYQIGWNIKAQGQQVDES